jgi:hypothetical protein
LKSILPLFSAIKGPLPDWIKTLTIALVTSFFTLCLIEPVRAVIQRWLRRRELRRTLYHEMVLNFSALDGQVVMAERHAEMKAGIDGRFRRAFKKSCFELAQRDPLIYYGLGYDERYWIELLYSGMEGVFSGDFKDDEQLLRNASFNAHSFLTYIKNRYVNKRLILKVSPVHTRKYIRERLPEIDYVDVEPPTFLERIRRTFD